MNDDGLVVGTYTRYDPSQGGSGTEYGFIYDTNTHTYVVPQFDIPGITSNDTGSTNISSADQLLSINDAGTIVGTSPTQGGFEVNPAPVDTIDNGGTLYVAQPSNDTVKFAGNTGTLVLDDLTDFHGQIQNFTGTAPDAAHSDVIDLAGVNFNSASFSESYNISTGVLTVSDGTDTGSLSFANFNGTFKFASDGHGGTDIFDPPAANNTSPPVSVGNDHFHFHPELGAGSDNAGTQGNDAAHDHLAGPRSEEWSTLIADAQETGTADGAQPAESHWHHALHNATHLH